jgi:hypothetical protein
VVDGLPFFAPAELRRAGKKGFFALLRMTEKLFLSGKNRRRVSFSEDYYFLRRRCLSCATVSLSRAGQASPSHLIFRKTGKPEAISADGEE